MEKFELGLQVGDLNTNYGRYPYSSPDRPRLDRAMISHASLIEADLPRTRPSPPPAARAQHSTTTTALSGASGLAPLAGQCLCGDYTLVVTNPRPGMILCHCFDCQINSASFFGTYITAESRKDVIIVARNRPEHEPALGSYDAQPSDAPQRCPRTFCRCCGTMLFAEPSTLGIVVINCSIFQKHKHHPAMQPVLEIFTTRRSRWLTPRENTLQAPEMPVLNSDHESSSSSPTPSDGDPFSFYPRKDARRNQYDADDQVSSDHDGDLHTDEVDRDAYIQTQQVLLAHPRVEVHHDMSEEGSVSSTRKD